MSEESNDRKIEDAAPDTNVQGNELIPVSDDNLPKCISVGQIKNFTIAQIAEIASAQGIDLDEDGVYLLQGGALKPLNASTLAAAVLDYGFGLAPVSSISGNEVVGVKDSGAKKTITLSALQTWLGANLDIASMTQAGNLAATDLAVVSQASGVRKVTLGSFSAFVHNAFAAFVASLTAKNENLTGEELIYIVDANNVAKRTKVSALLTALGGGDVRGPATTTEGNVPRWDATQKKLTGGLPVATAIADTPDAANPRIPTEKAVKDKLDLKVDAEDGKGLSTNDFTDDDKDKVDASLTPEDVEPETIEDGVKIATIGGKDIMAPQGGGGGSDVLYPRIEPVIVASDGETITLQNRKFNTVVIGEHENVTINVPEFSDEAPIDLILGLYFGYESSDDEHVPGTIVSEGTYIETEDVGNYGRSNHVEIGHHIKDQGVYRLYSERSEEYDGSVRKILNITRYGGLSIHPVLRAVKSFLMPSSVSAPEPTDNYYPRGTIWIQGGSDPHIMLDDSTNPMQTFGRWARLPTFVCNEGEPTGSSYAAMWFCTTSNKFYINLMYGRNTALSQGNVWKEVQFVN